MNRKRQYRDAVLIDSKPLSRDALKEENDVGNDGGNVWKFSASFSGRVGHEMLE